MMDDKNECFEWISLASLKETTRVIWDLQKLRPRNRVSWILCRTTKTNNSGCTNFVLFRPGAAHKLCTETVSDCNRIQPWVYSHYLESSVKRCLRHAIMLRLWMNWKVCAVSQNLEQHQKLLQNCPTSNTRLCVGEKVDLRTIRKCKATKWAGKQVIRNSVKSTG